MRQDLDRLRNAWTDGQANRGRNAIYGYLSAMYGLVAWWAAEGRDLDRARRALRLQGLKASDREDPFAAVIRCTADPVGGHAEHDATETQSNKLPGKDQAPRVGDHAGVG
jgi:hypothetical protein